MIRSGPWLLAILHSSLLVAAPGGVSGTCEDPADAGVFQFEKIAVWRDDASAAYTIIHDDMCRPALSGIQDLAIPELNGRGLTAGLGTFASACEDGSRWDLLAMAESGGHEILNHSYHHVQVTPGNAAVEIHSAKAALERHTVRPVTFYVFPFDSWSAETLAEVARAGHLGARAGAPDDNDGFDNPPINPADPINDMAVEFDVWPRALSKYSLYRPEDLLTVHAYNAIDRGGWAVREFHSVSAADAPPGDGSQGFGPVPLEVYRRHLDFLVDARRANRLWIGTPTTVIRYRRARKTCRAVVLDGVIRFDTSDPDCRRFATPLSVIVRSRHDVASVSALQAGETIPTRKLRAGVFSITADPTLGEVALSGCDDPGDQVEPDVVLPPRPRPAESACHVQSVLGSGIGGLMDDLERIDASFLAWPNPAQRDGRDGTWSWYPLGVSVDLVDRDGSRVLRFAGKDLDEWSGVRLAFLGSGGGGCYDASSYRGVRFKIRGGVVGRGDLAGRIFVGAITAETQSRGYGGDLVGEGGHFHKVVDVTADWRTVAIEWGEFEPPTWGDTATRTELALGKLQLLDFGVAAGVSEFELFLDDIELYGAPAVESPVRSVAASAPDGPE